MSVDDFEERPHNTFVRRVQLGRGQAPVDEGDDDSSGDDSSHCHPLSRAPDGESQQRETPHRDRKDSQHADTGKSFVTLLMQITVLTDNYAFNLLPKVQEEFVPSYQHSRSGSLAPGTSFSRSLRSSPMRTCSAIASVTPVLPPSTTDAKWKPIAPTCSYHEPSSTRTSRLSVRLVVRKRRAEPGRGSRESPVSMGATQGFVWLWCRQTAAGAFK
jgi:hypothetical protein